MVSSYCAVQGCRYFSHHSYSGVRILRISQRKSQEFLAWINGIKKYTTVNKYFKRQIEARDVFICENIGVGENGLG